jgi:dolichol-phosphate mannosyltransferase
MPTRQARRLEPRIAVVIPCFRVKQQILSVVERIGPVCSAIYVVDDACPEQTGRHVEENCHDPRVRVLRHERNQGVGGATMTGYTQALADGADVVVKLDGDGQMDPALIDVLVQPILKGEADYAKGNRFYDLSGLKQMPTIRIIGNAILSFFSKLSDGYWGLFDPTNGFTAIQAAVLARLPLDKISPRYFFESDLLFQLSLMRAVAVDVPMQASYGAEESSLRIRRVLLEFTAKHLRNFARRVFYNYFLRDFSIASVELSLGTALLLFGIAFGSVSWYSNVERGVFSSSGTVMLAALPILLGLQMMLAFLAFDIGNVPTRPLHPALSRRPALAYAGSEAASQEGESGTERSVGP